MEETGGMSPPPEQAARTVNGPRRSPPFDNTTLIVFALVWVVLHFVWSRLPTTEDRMTALYYPAETALWYANAGMLAYKGVEQLGGFEKLVVLASDEVEADEAEHISEVLQEAIEELEKRGGGEEKIRQLRANLAIQLAESGNLAGMRAELTKLSEEGKSEDFIRLFELVYESKGDWNRGAFDFGQLGENWMKWQFEAKAARLTGDQAGSEWLENWLRRAEGKRGLTLFYVSLANWLLVIGGSILVLSYIWKKVGVTWPVERTGFPESWREGLGIFLTGELAGVALFWYFAATALFSRAAMFSHSLLGGIPVLILIWWRWGRHEGVRWRNFLGLAEGAAGLNRLFKQGVMAFPMLWCAITIPGMVFDLYGESGHWTEGWSEAEMFEPWPWRWVPLIDAVIWAPLFEEVAFRGTLYAGLRCRMSVWPAMVISSLLFGAMHDYSLAGFVSVSLFGMAAAWLYERTGSWVPGFVAHLLTNLTLSVWWAVLF